MKIFESTESLREALPHGAISDMVKFIGCGRTSIDDVIRENNTKHPYYRAISAYAVEGAAAFRIAAREDRIIKGPVTY